MYALKVNMSALVDPVKLVRLSYTSKVNINMLTVNMLFVTMRTTNLVLHDITTDMQVTICLYRTIIINVCTVYSYIATYNQ